MVDVRQFFEINGYDVKQINEYVSAVEEKISTSITEKCLYL